MAGEGKSDKGAKPVSKSAMSAGTESKKSKDEAAAAAKKLEVAKAAEDADEEQDAREGDEEEEAAPAAKADKAKAKPAKDADEEGDEGEAKGEKAEKKAKLKPRPRPKLDGDLKRALEQRKVKSANRQEFHRQEWFRYQRLGDKWRYPGGIQSKMRRHWGTHADVVSIGHRGPKAARGLHPSGFREVVVHNPEGLDSVDPASEAVRIAGSVGRRKREVIQKTARSYRVAHRTRFILRSSLPPRREARPGHAR